MQRETMISPAPMSSPDGIASLIGGAATPPAFVAAVPGASYSLAAASGAFAVSPDAPSVTPSREGGECCPAPIQAFMDAWISASPPAPRDFTFKTVIGEPDW